jgi:hypothetical protein
MALKEPYMNNPRRQPGVKKHTTIISSEGAEYIVLSRNQHDTDADKKRHDEIF